MTYKYNGPNIHNLLNQVGCIRENLDNLSNLAYGLMKDICGNIEPDHVDIYDNAPEPDGAVQILSYQLATVDNKIGALFSMLHAIRDAAGPASE